MPPSQEEKPGAEWPPPRTATIRSRSRAAASAARTSATDAHCATAAGRLSTMPLAVLRASS